MWPRTGNNTGSTNSSVHEAMCIKKRFSECGVEEYDRALTSDLTTDSSYRVSGCVFNILDTHTHSYCQSHTLSEDTHLLSPFNTAAHTGSTTHYPQHSPSHINPSYILTCSTSFSSHHQAPTPPPLCIRVI